MSKWALVSVFDKRGIVDFCHKLASAGYQFLSTGGTAKHLLDAGLSVTQVEDYTGFPEILGGRVKTLHPKIHGGLLGLRDEPSHVARMRELGIEEIDMVVVNLYPFQKTIEQPDVSLAEAIEMIDIGGPSMLRSAAKNHRFCLPVIDPNDYDWIADALQSENGVTSTQRMKLAQKAFALTSAYDAVIANYLQSRLDAETEAEPSVWPSVLNLSFTAKQVLRYGENPHQAAQFYTAANATPATIAGAVQLQGKQLSYNNIQDADAALNILRGFDDLKCPVAVAVKHMNPCGIGRGPTMEDAFNEAYEADPVSIFGGIIACNRTVEKQLAQRLTTIFLEVVIAPAFSEDALLLFKRKKNVRLLTVTMDEPLWQPGDFLLRRVSGGLLVQEVNLAKDSEWKVVTSREPSPEETQALAFAWRAVRFVKSNAIVLATENRTLGVGAGQMNRVGAARIAIEQAGVLAQGSVMASDAFFPMRDTVDAAAAAGVTAIIQPGGSIKDADSIAAADEHNIAMVFTGQRHFLH